MPCGRTGKPCAVKPNEQPSDGMEPERGGPDVTAEGISDEWGKIIDLLKYQEEKKKREEEVAKKEELVREVRKRQAGRKYAEQLQGSIPGLETHTMKWMRDLVSQGTPYIA